jgi:hypothetical protein
VTRPYPTRTFNPTGTLPEELAALDQWVPWKLVHVPGKAKPDKVPRDRANTRNVSALDPANQLSFDAACAAFHGIPSLAGIGFALRIENGIVGIDLDHAIDLATGEIAEWAREIVADFGGYWEVSPSGEGLRSFVRGSLPKDARRKVGNIEVYDSGRWLSVTGNVFVDEPIVANDAALGRLVARMGSEAKRGQSTSLTTAAPSTIDDKAKAELRSALAALRADDRDLWIGVAHDLRELGEVGRALWLEWSQTSEKYQPGDAKQWDTITSWRSGYRNVFARAQREGWCNPLAGSSPAPIAASAEPASSSLVDVAIPADFMTAEHRLPEEVIERMVVLGELAGIGGHGGVGKSAFGLMLVAHKSPGVAWNGHTMTAGRAVFVSLEDSAQVILYRLQRIVRAYRLDPDAVRENLRIVDGSLGTSALVHEDRKTGRLAETPTFDALRDRVRGAALVVIDNVSQAYRANSNDPALVGEFLSKLKVIARENRAGIVLLQHVDKAAAKFGANGNAYLGTVAWHNDVRARHSLTEGEAGSVILAKDKFNYGKKAGDPITLRWNADGVLVPAGNANAQDGSALVANADDAIVLDAIRAACDSGITIPTATRGSNTALHALCELPEFPSHLRTRSSRDRVTHALVRLQRAGSIERQTYTTAARHARERFVVADPAPIPARAVSPSTPAETGATGAAGSADCASFRQPAKPAKPAQSKKSRRDRAA